MNLRRKMGKRIASWLLCMAMALTLIPATVVHADEPGLIIPNATISEDGILSWDPAESELSEYPAPKIDDYEVLITDEGGGPTTYVKASVHGLSCDINAMCSDAGLSTGVYEIRLYPLNIVEGFERWPKFLEYAYIAKTYINKVNIIGISKPIVGDRVGDNLDKITTGDSSYVIANKRWWCNTSGHIKQMSSDDVFEEGLEYSLQVYVEPSNSAFYMNKDTVLVFNSGNYATDYYSLLGSTSMIGNTVSIASGNHDFSKYVSNGNGTHKVVCKDCGAVQEGHDKDACSGGTATCTAKAKCSKCKAEYGSLKAHTNEATTTKATLTANGKKVTKCSVCGKSTTTTIYYPKTIKLSATAYTYDGNVKKPSVSVVDANGKTIAASNYTVTYASGRKNVGSYTVKVAFKGNYSGTKSLTFKINPPKTALKTLTKGTKSFKATWTKKSTQVTGYQIQYSTSSTFASGNKTATVTSYKTVSKTIKSLKAKKKYYVRIRTYKTVSGTKYYSDWSAKKYVTTK